MKISQKTQKLIDRMCRNVEREDFRLKKEKAEKCIMRTYDIFDLSRPKKVVWLKDIFGRLSNIARSARLAWSAGSSGSSGSSELAWSSGLAGLARSAWSAGLAWSSGSSGLAWSSGSAGSSWLAWSKRSSGSAGSSISAWSSGSSGLAGSALDYDFDRFVMENEYCQNRKDNPGDEPNENDYRYLEYCELLMQAKEWGLGYRIEWEDTLYLVPTPLVKIDEQNKFHHFLEPAIRWKEGKEFYFLHGVNFSEKLFKKVVGKTMSFKEISALKNIEQRMIAFKLNPAVLEEAGKLIDKSDRGNELYRIDNIFPQTEYFIKYACPSTNRIYFKCVKPEIGAKGNADECQASTFRLSLQEYYSLNIEA